MGELYRIAVVGNTGCGKSTLAAAIAERLNIRFVELDALYWQQPDWAEPDHDEFRTKLEAFISDGGWVAAGNYSLARDLIWSRVDTIVWIDYPLVVCLWRLFWRSVRRATTKEDLWGSGNVETLRKQFLTRESLFLWAIKTNRRRRRQFPIAFAQPEYQHINVLRFGFPWQTAKWLKSLPATNTQ